MDLLQCMCLRRSLIFWRAVAPLINFQELQRWRGLVRSCPLLDPQISRQKVQLETLHETETIAVSDSAKKTTGRWEAIGMGVGENSGILGTKWVTSGRHVVPGGSRWKTNGKQEGNRRKTGC